MPDSLDSLREENRRLRAFASHAAHDLKDPLAKITRFMRLAGEARQEGDTAAEAAALDAVRRAAARASALVSSLLQLARAGQGGLALAPVDAVTLVREALEEASLPPGTGVYAQLEPVTMQADPVLAALLLANIIGNAVKFASPARPLQLHIRLERLGFGARLQIADNGTGLKPEDAEAIFEPFRRLGNPGTAGSGLGLAICREIAAAHGWSISGTGTEGEGATFTVTFPDVSEG